MTSRSVLTLQHFTLTSQLVCGQETWWFMVIWQMKWNPEIWLASYTLTSHNTAYQHPVWLENYVQNSKLASFLGFPHVQFALTVCTHELWVVENKEVQGAFYSGTSLGRHHRDRHCSFTVGGVYISEKYKSDFVHQTISFWGEGGGERWVYT